MAQVAHDLKTPLGGNLYFIDKIIDRLKELNIKD